MKRARQNEFIFPIETIHVIDGDTFKVELSKGCGDFYRGSCRLVTFGHGIDTPEKNTLAGQYVRAYVNKILVDEGGAEQCQLLGFGKWAGRFLGRILYRPQGDPNAPELAPVDLCAHLLDECLGREYKGRKREPWTVGEDTAVIKRCQLLGVSEADMAFSMSVASTLEHEDTFDEDLAEWVR